MRSIDNYQRLVDLVPSPVNGITLCQGNFTLMTDDLPSVILHFCCQKKVFFVHFRDVRGNVEKFEETWHDAGKTNLLECMRAYRDVGFEGVLGQTMSDGGGRQQRAAGVLVVRSAVRERLVSGLTRGGVRRPSVILSEERAEVTYRRGSKADLALPR
jgi:hypothetical protein